MSKRKGLSAEEKRTRMLELFYEKRDCFLLKELEKIAPKEKGIISQSVKDVVQALVDDGLVDSDKIGTSNFYWAYPSKALHNRKRKLAALSSKLEECNKKLKKCQVAISEASIGREDTDERTKVLAELYAKRTEYKEVQQEIQKCRDSDPEVLEQIRQETIASKDAANKWTENIFAIKSWCKNKFFMEGSVLDKQFGIDPDMDYLP